MRRVNFITIVYLLFSFSVFAEQIHLPTVDKMPNLPTPAVLRDWRQVARNVDSMVCDFSKKGDCLPLPWWDRSRINYPMDAIALPAYVGSRLQHKESNAYDTITCFGAVLGATLIGIDKSGQNGPDYVEMLNTCFQKKNGIDLYLNNVSTVTGDTFWYELLPSLLFYQIYDHYRDTPEMASNFIRTAERWHEAILGLGGSPETDAVPNFDWTAYNFKKGVPVDNGRWKEPDAAAGVAWLQYMAYSQTSNKTFLNGAELAMKFLDQRVVNPYYECILPYGAYISARMNAELGSSHQTEKFVNWVLDGDNPRKWGVTSGGWGAPDCAGLAGSVYSGHEYAFAMNTFLTAGVMLPIVRYDDRYAEAFGKWMLNVAVNSRFFYADAWSPEDQTCYEWAKKNDPDFCLAYEGVRKQGWTRTYPVEDVVTEAGRVAGTWLEASYDDGQKQVLIADGLGAIRHVWKFKHVAGLECLLVLFSESFSDGAEYRFSVSDQPERGWHDVFTVTSKEKRRNKWQKIDSAHSGFLYVKVEGTASPGSKLEIDNFYIQTKLNKSPYAKGDAIMMGWGKTDIGLYGSVFVGMLAALVEPTDVAGILQLDCRKTESFAAPSYPTYLYYNPYREKKEITVSLPAEPVDLYDAVSNRFIARAKSEATEIRIESRSAMLVIQCPSGGALTYDGPKTKVNGIVIDYNNERTEK